MKKLSSLILAMVMLISSILVAPLNVLANTYSMSDLEELCEAYSEKVSSDIYTNESAAYTAYENAKQYIDATEYGDVSTSSVDTYYNALNTAINNMQKYEFSYTEATVKSPTSKEVISSDSSSGIVYYGGLGSITGFGSNDYLATGIYMGDLVWLYDGSTELRAPINSYMQYTTKVDLGMWKTYVKCRYVAITNTNDISLRDTWWQSCNTVNDFYTRTNCTGGKEVGNLTGMSETWIFGSDQTNIFNSGTSYIASNTLTYNGELDNTKSYSQYNLAFEGQNNYDNSHNYNLSSNIYVLNYKMLDNSFDYALSLLSNIDDYSSASTATLMSAIDSATSFNVADYNFSSDVSLSVANAATDISNYSSAITNVSLTYVADYSQLRSAIAENQALYKAGQSTYTDITWTNFKNAYDSAVAEMKSVATSGYLTRQNQSRINAYTTNLTSSKATLKTVESDVNYTTNGNTASISGLNGSDTKEINIPNSIGSCTSIVINNYSFTNNTTVERVNIPSTVTSVGEGSFSNCENLKDVYIEGDDTIIEDGCFDGCSDDLVIHCNPNSNAWQYAVSNGIKTCCITHTYNAENTVTTPATCTEDGLVTYTCKDCGYYYSEKIVKLGHDPQFVETVAPSCESIGYDLYACSRCGNETMTNKVSSLGGHNYSVVKQTVAPTCTTQGYTVYNCANCDETKRDNYTDALNHDFSEYVSTVAATCSVDGYDVYKCSRCDETTRKYSTTELALGHEYVKQSTVAPTCSHQGYTVYKCSRCGDIKNDDYVNALAHSYATTTTKATTTKNGKTVTTCTKCGNVQKTVTIYKASKASLSATAYSYTGKVKKPSVVVKTSKGVKLVNGTDYTVKYSNSKSKKVGKYSVKITFKGKYSGTKTLTYTIGPKTTEKITKLSSKKKTITVKYKKNSVATGYQIQYSTSKSFTSSTTKTVTVSKKSTTSKTIKKLKKGKKYYVRVRAYKTVKGKKCYAAWSAKKSIKCK